MSPLSRCVCVSTLCVSTLYYLLSVYLFPVYLLCIDFMCIYSFPPTFSYSMNTFFSNAWLPLCFCCFHSYIWRVWQGLSTTADSISLKACLTGPVLTQLCNRARHRSHIFRVTYATQAQSEQVFSCRHIYPLSMRHRLDYPGGVLWRN